MSLTKTYFLCPVSEFIHPPPDGPLFLGSIIRSTSTPQSPLNRATAVPVDDENPAVLETDWKKTISAATGAGAGVYAQFLQLGPEVEIGHSTKNANVFAFDTVTTLSFEPTPQYITEAINVPTIQTWLREPKQRFNPSVSLFLVTGMKLVKGARIKYSTSKSTTAITNLGVDVGPLSTVNAGAKGHWKRTNNDETDFNRESEFVFAFRVKRLRFGRKLKAEEYNKGAFLAVGEGKDDEESVLAEDIDGCDIKAATLVPDAAGSGNVYCVAG